MIVVPFMKKPSHCEECPFAVCRYSHPFKDGTDGEYSKGYNCNVDYYENGKYTILRNASYDDDIVPENCPLDELEA